jgi:peptidoglycan/xylan/chitin deacetylase (PgdA/CDA1 family)
VQRRFINITFHGIGAHDRTLDDGEAGVWVSVARFRSVLDAVAGRDDVRITFDDGNASDVAHALPELRERGLTATFFVVAGRLGMPEFLSAADLRMLVQEGMTIGSHGMHHRPWRSLDDASLEEELVDSKRMLEDAIGRGVTDAACPFGSYGRRSLRALQAAGYRHVFTSDRGPARADDWLQARTTVNEHDAIEPVLSSQATLRRNAKLAVKRWR